MMPTWIWILLCILCGAMGFLAAALCSAAGGADDWERGYWAGRLWKDAVKYHKEHEND
jgi:hypothetical protein